MENKQNNRVESPLPVNHETINIREYVIKYLKKWYWFVLSVIICLLFANFYLKFQNDLYQTQTTILLRNDPADTGVSEMAILNGLGLNAGTSKQVEDEIQVLTSKSVMRQVIENLGLNTEYYIKAGFKDEELYPKSPLKLALPFNYNDTVRNDVSFKIVKSGNAYDIKIKSGHFSENYSVQDITKPISTSIGTFRFYLNAPLVENATYRVITYPKEYLVNRYCDNVKVSSVDKKSNAINVSTVNANKTKAENILNKLIEIYNMDAVIDKNMIASNTADFIEDRLKIIGSELYDVELNVENYKKKNNLTDLSSEADLYLQTASEYDKKLSETDTQLKLIVYLENYVKDNKNQYSLIPVNIGIQDQNLPSMVEDYNKMILERMKVLRTANENNPVVSQFDQQLKAVKQTLLASISNIKEGLNITKRDFLGKDTQFNSKIRNVPTQERQFLEIKRQQEIKQNLYVFLLQKREENALTLASTVPSARTLDLAYSSISPISPNRKMIYLLALFFGLIIPAVVFYLYELFNFTIVDKKEYLKLVKAPFLGSIGLAKESDKIVVREGRTTPIVEMFRLVRTNLQFMLNDAKSPVILITSSISGEGKSFTAINLAMSLALMKKKVVILGLDIRNPMLGDYLSIPKNKGITLYLSDSGLKPTDIVFPSGIHPYLNVIPAGPVPPNPAELLMSPRLDELIAELKQEYDFIVIDSAPVGVVTDTYLINRIIDNCIYVSRQNYTPREVATLINDVYESKKLKNMSVVFNGTAETSSYGYNYHGRKYKYKYRYAKSNKQKLMDKISGIFKK